jgi:RNA polymerase primary sigma factor
MTLEQIGRAFDPPISRERVRQIEERAFQKIRERRREVLGQFLRGDVP